MNNPNDTEKVHFYEPDFGAPYRRMSKIYDQIFKRTSPYQIFKRTSPVKPIPEGLVKKENCNCGLHRKSELIRRMKPLAGIREKTLTDYADEL
jgi:hypothetical protein